MDYLFKAVHKIDYDAESFSEVEIHPMSTSRRYDTQLNTELKRVQKNIESQVFLHSFCLQLAKKML